MSIPLGVLLAFSNQVSTISLFTKQDSEISLTCIFNVVSKNLLHKNDV